LAVKITRFSPSGKFGAIMDKTFSAELSYMNSFENRIRFRLGASFASLTPRLDTFPICEEYITYGYVDSILSGYQVYNKYDLLMFSFGLDCSVLELEPFYLYSGIDFIIGLADIDSKKVINNSVVDSYLFPYFLAGTKLRAGAEFIIKERLAIFSEISQSFYFQFPTEFYSFNEVGLGIRFIF
jgi:hypothetical protein